MTGCPVCLSTRLFYIRHIKGQRTGKYLRLNFCVNCHSLFNPSEYKEDDKAMMADKNWHVSNFNKVTNRTSILLTRLKAFNPTPRTLLDIGSGVGATVLQAKSLGFDAIGVEPNHYAVNYAKEQFSLDLRRDYFNRNLFQNRFDVITCIHVLEHLDNPRKLFQDAIETLNRPGLIFLSVPFIRAITLPIYTLFPNLRGSPFHDNDVHIIHYSHKAFGMWAQEFGAHSCEYIKDGWPGYLLKYE